MHWKQGLLERIRRLLRVLLSDSSSKLLTVITLMDR